VEFLRDILGEELYAKVEEKLSGNDKVKLANLADGGYVSKDKFLSEQGKLASLNEQLDERGLQLESLKESSGNNEALQMQIEKLQKENDENMKKLQVKHAVEMALKGANVRAVKAVMPFLDLENAELDGEKVVGLDEQIERLKSDSGSKFLFNKEEKTTSFRGMKPGEASDGGDMHDSGVKRAERAYRNDPSLDNMVKLSRARINNE
jgi:hypothetical protein